MALRPESARGARENAVAYLAGAFERPPARVSLRRALGGLRALWPNSLGVALFRSGTASWFRWALLRMNESCYYFAGRLNSASRLQTRLDVKQLVCSCTLAPARLSTRTRASRGARKRSQRPRKPVFSPASRVAGSAHSEVKAKTGLQPSPPTQQAARGSLERPPAPLRAARCNRRKHRP